MFTAHVLMGMGLGFVAGAFMPGITRKIKGLWVKETQQAKKVVFHEYDTVVKDVKDKL